MSENKNTRIELNLEDVEAVTGGRLTLRRISETEYGIVQYDVNNKVVDVFPLKVPKDEASAVLRTYWNQEGDGTRDQQMLSLLRSKGMI